MNSFLKLLFVSQLVVIYYCKIRENYRKYICILDLLLTTTTLIIACFIVSALNKSN